VPRQTGTLPRLLTTEAGAHAALSAGRTEQAAHWAQQLLDMVMPETSGSETFAALRELNPKIPVLVMSGYDQDGCAQALIDGGAAGFLQKPFSMADLAGKVGRALRA
jgi:CheY-like chemotaxis protein